MSRTIRVPEIDESLLRRARALHERSLLIDGHADTLNRIVSEGHSFIEPSPDLHLDWPRLQAAQINVQCLSLWIDQAYLGERATRRALDLIAAFFERARKVSDLRTVTAPSQLDARRPGFVFAFEGADPLGDDLNSLEVFYRLGVRMIGLTWNGRNAFADGLKVGPKPSGLTSLGRELIARMGELGVVPDVSHLAEPGFWEVVELASGPVVASHANTYSRHAHPRNLRDDQIKAIADKGGLVGITFVPHFLADSEADLDDVLTHLDHVIELVGDDYVGLGSDFDGITVGPTRLEEVSMLPNLTAGMLAIGYSEERIAKILGLNWARVFRAVWKESDRML